MCSITEHRVLELIPVLGSQPAGDVSHKPDGRLSLLSARPTVTFQLRCLVNRGTMGVSTEQFARDCYLTRVAAAI